MDAAGTGTDGAASADARPAMPTASRSGRLPSPATSFIGRKDDIAALGQRLAEPECRLVTLVGPGGVGKTRLAIEVARSLHGDDSARAAFVPLQPVRSHTDIESAIAAALGVPMAGAMPPMDQLLAFLADKHLLLVLDNFEHLAERAGVVAEMLSGAPGLKAVVTSREVLNIAYEWVYPVEGLGVDTTAENNHGAPAITLFSDRAQRIRHGFTLDGEHQAVVRICSLLEGMPLAIELAASWTKAMNCSDIESELRRGGAQLASSLRDVSPQHRSMTAVFDQSWSLLTEEERTAFMRLSVFQGGFTRPAAERVAGASLTTLMRLVDKSLIRPAPDGRFDMHELLRQYAESRLEAAGLLAETRDAHADWLVEFLESWQPELAGGDYVAASRVIAAEIANVRTAWRWAVGNGQLARRTLAVEALSAFYESFDDDVEGCSLFQQLIDVLESCGPLQVVEANTLAVAYTGKGYLAIRLGRVDEADEAFRRGRALLDEHQLSHMPGRATDPRIGLGLVGLIGGDLSRVEQVAQEALDVAEAEQHRWNRHYALYLLARVAVIRGDLESGRRLGLRSHALTLEANDNWFLAHILNELGSIAVALGELDEGRRFHEAAYQERARANDRRGMAEAVHRLGMVALAQHDIPQAIQHFRWALTIQEQTHDSGAIAAALYGLALAAMENGDYATAAPQLRRSLAIAQSFRFVGQQLAAIGAAGELMAATRRTERAVELLALVRDHPACEDETGQRATYALGHLERELSPGRFARAAANAASLELDEVIGEVLGELTAVEPVPVPIATVGLSPAVELTAREREVAALLAEGRSNREIAEALGVSDGTVKAHTANIYNKLGVDNRVQAAARARELGLSGR